MEDSAPAEACALRYGLLFAGEIGCNKLLMESDCKEVVETMQIGGNSFGPAAAVYEECSFLCRGFARVCFSHCPREANRAADTLAKLDEMHHVVWDGDPPICILDVIANDVTLLD